jgi:membrane peptidoglycan carboxypeptidase
MIIRTTISFFAKRIYKKSFDSLKTRLLEVYIKLNTSQFDEQNDILEKLLISGEDHRFRYHIGFDLFAILRAIRNRIIYNKKEGASTIDQQLVRVLTNKFEKTLKRKIKEIFLSTTLPEIIPRKKIPRIYLQVAYFGADMNGLEQVLKRFKISNKNKITTEIAAEIVSRIKYPEPKFQNEKRTRQIALRKNHLLYLYEKHSSRKFMTIYG